MINAQTQINGGVKTKSKSFWKTLFEQRQLAVLSLPFLVFIIIFNYIPIWGWIMAFQNYRPHKGITGSTWVGLKQFRELFTDPVFLQAIKNTLAISSLKLITGFACSIALALLINEIRNALFKRTVQTVAYLPYFVSWVVAASLVKTALSPESGFVSLILKNFNLISDTTNIMSENKYFWIILAVSNIWKEAGWGTIVYLSAMAGIDNEMYEAAYMDGAGRLRRIFSITLPSIAPTIKVLLILSVGWILSAGFDQVYLLKNDLVSEVSNTIEIYIYTYGIKLQRYSLSTACGIFNSVVGLALVFGANTLAKKMDGEKAF